MVNVVLKKLPLIFSTALYSALTFNAGFAYSAGIVADGSTATTVTTVNQVHIVDIATPTAGGVSQNRFDRFSIDNNGAIMNNSTLDGTSNLAGQVQANSNLSAGSASIILNEVTSNRQSNLNGVTEIFGDNARYILSNPNGITCDGCGFIRTPTAVGDSGTRIQDVFLTTGTATVNATSGLPITLRIDNNNQARLIIGQNGLDSSNVDITTLLTRRAEINGIVNAASSQLHVYLGKGSLSVNNNAASSWVADATGNNINVAIDATSAGAMNAGQIFIQSTEEGAGVTLPDNLLSTGGISITAAGDIVYRNATAQAGDVRVSATGTNTAISTNGSTTASINVALNATGDINYNNATAQTGNVTVTTQRADAQITVSGNTSASNNITLNISGSRLRVTGSGSAATFSAGNTLLVNCTGGDGSCDLQSQRELILQAALLQSNANINTTSGNNLSVTAAVATSQGFNSGANATFTSTSGDINIAGSLIAANNIQLTSALNAQIILDGNVQSGGDIAFLGQGSYVHDNVGTFTIGGRYQFDLYSLTNNAVLANLQNGTLQVTQLTNTGLIQNQAALNLKVDDTLNNSGIIASLEGAVTIGHRNANLKTNSITNSGVIASIDLTNSQLGQTGLILDPSALIAEHTAKILRGEQRSAEDLAKEISTQNAALIADLNANASVTGVVTINANTLTNTASGRISGSDVAFAVGTLNNQGGQILAGRNLNVQGINLSNTNTATQFGVLTARDNLNLTLSNRFTNTGLVDGGDVRINAATQNNTGSNFSIASLLGAKLDTTAQVNPLSQKPWFEAGTGNAQYQFINAFNNTVIDSNLTRLSDAFIQASGATINPNNQMVGDDVYIAELIVNTLRNNGGVPFVTNERDALGQLNSLYANTQAYMTKTGLRFGQTPSAQQQTQIAAPVLVFVAQDQGNGQQVYIPQVWMPTSGEGINAQADRISTQISAVNDLLLTGNTITSQDADFIAGENLVIEAVDLTLSGETRKWYVDSNGKVHYRSAKMAAGDSVQVKLSGNYVQKGAQVLAANQIVVQAKSISISNNENRQAKLTAIESFNTTHGKEQKLWSSLLSLGLTRADNMLANKVLLNAQEDITLKNANLRTATASTKKEHAASHQKHENEKHENENTTTNALTLIADNGSINAFKSYLESDAIAMQAKKGIALNATKNSTTRRIRNGYTTTTRYDVTKINSRGNLFIEAGNDLTTQGAQLIAGNNANNVMVLNAGGNMLLDAVNNETYTRTSTSSRTWWGSSKSSTRESQRIRSQGTNIVAGNLFLNANNDTLAQNKTNTVQLVGSQINVTNNTVIKAKGDVNIYAALDTNYDRTTSSKSSWFGLSSSASTSRRSQQLLNASNLESRQGDLSLLSGNNITVVASNLTSGQNINLQADNNLLIAAAEQLSDSREGSTRSGFFTGGDVYNSKQTQKGTTTRQYIGSTLNAANDINLQASRAKIIGSTLLAGNNINAQTDVGDIEIVTATNSQNSYTYKKEVRVGFGDVAKNILQPEQWIKTENGRLTLTLADATYDESDSKNSESTAQSSVLQAGNSINLTAAGDITVEGSQLLADAANDDATDKQNKTAVTGNLNLTAGGDIRITDASNRYKNQTKDISGKAELSLVVQNQVIETANAAKGLEQAKQQFKQAQESYRQYEKDLKKQKAQLAKLEAGDKNNEVGINQEDIRELREFIQSAESDKSWYDAGIAAAALNLTSKSTLLIQQTAALAQSGATYGFNAGVQLDIDASKTNTTQNQTTSVASILQGRNITLSNQGDTLIKGSTLQAKNTLSIDTRNLNIFASRDSANNTNKTEQGSISIAQTVYGTAGGPTVNASMSQSRAQNSQITYTNSTLRGKNLTLTTQENATLRGATVRADETLVASIGGDLTIESVQNKTQGKNNSFSLSGGFGFGAAEGSKANSKTLGGAVSNFGQSSGDVASVNAGLSAGAGRSRTKQTVLSSLTAGNTANVIVKGRTQLKGALLATVDKDNNDLGNLNLSTGSFGFEDLSNTRFNTNKNAGLSSSVGLGSKATTGSVDKTNNNATGTKLNTTKVQYVNSTGYTKTKTLATLGKGTIQITNSDDETLTRLNRDTTKTNKDIYKTKRQQGNIDLTIDTRLFSKDGRNAIKEDVERTKRMGQAILDVATKKTYTFFDTLAHIDETQKDLDVQKAFALQNNGQGINALQGSGSTIEEKQSAIKEYAQIYADVYGVSIEAATIIAVKKVIGGTTYTNAAETTSRIAINDNAQRNATDYASTLGHEVTHARIRQGTTRDRGNKDLNEEYADSMGEYSADGMVFSARTYNGIELNRNEQTNLYKRDQKGNAILASNNTNWRANLARARNNDGTVDYLLPEFVERWRDNLNQYMEENRKISASLKGDGLGTVLSVAAAPADILADLTNVLITTVDITTDGIGVYGVFGKNLQAEALQNLNDMGVKTEYLVENREDIANSIVKTLKEYPDRLAEFDPSAWRSLAALAGELAIPAGAIAKVNMGKKVDIPKGGVNSLDNIALSSRSGKAWAKNTVLNRIVHQRNDLFEPNQITTWREGGKVFRGTNLERMATGRAPQGIDGKSVELHHLTQNEVNGLTGSRGALAEVGSVFHKKNTSTLHVPSNSAPSFRYERFKDSLEYRNSLSGIVTVPRDLNKKVLTQQAKEFSIYQSDYWKLRAENWSN